MYTRMKTSGRFKNKSPRKGTETHWHFPFRKSLREFKNKSPRKGTETTSEKSFSETSKNLKTKAPVRGRRPAVLLVFNDFFVI